MSHLDSEDGVTDSFTVESRDGTVIAVWVEGDGKPLVLVHGSFGDHTAWAAALDALRSDFTTFALDRRGFGASGDSVEYSIHRDFEDVATVVDAVAARVGGPVTLWGHSYGANCAMGAANLSSRVGHLVLYEPSLGLAYPPGVIEAAEEALAAGDREFALERMLVDVLEMSDEEAGALRASPRWPNLVAGAHTGPRECRTEAGWVYEPGQFDGIAAPTLFLLGSESPRSIVEATQRAAAEIPGARVRLLDGHGHFAHRTDPAMVAAVIREFVRA